MVYTWKDNNTGIIVEVNRSVKEIDVPPDKEEVLKVGMDIHDYAVAVWERIMSATLFIGPKGKGNW